MIAFLALVAIASDVRPFTPPRLLPGFTVSQSDYPPAALHQDVTGVVEFDVTVDADGAPSHCVVTTPLTPSLDEKTCAIVIARMHFAPARNKAGTAITAEYHSRIRWKIDDSIPPFQTRRRPLAGR